jgi:hypothetical protein
MDTPRRIYIYLVSAISLQAFAWAIIDLLRSLLISPFNTSSISIAMHIAIIIVSLPVYLIHWLWGQRIVFRDEEERTASIRYLYLFGMQAAFLAPLIASTFSLVNTILLWIAGQPPRRHYPELISGEAILFYLVPILVLGLLWFYHERVIQHETKEIVLQGAAATIRRLYVLGFSTVGLVMTTMGFMYLIRWIMFQIGGGDTIGSYRSIGYISEIARLIVGIPLWLVFWLWAQRLFYKSDDEERRSALRKFYLYAIIFASVISTVTSVTFILQGFISLLLGGSSASTSDGDIRIPISIIIPMIVLWVYHARVLKEDIKVADEVERQAGLRRLYYYLIAAIGLSAVLVGISGILNILIRLLSQATFSSGLREQLAWFTAVLIAGLPVWFIPWNQSQVRASSAEFSGISERHSLVRKIYLYFFLFIATITILSSLVYIIFRIISMALGEPPPSFSDLGQAIAYTLVALGVWFYHWSILSSDRKTSQLDISEEFQDTKVVVVDYGAQRFSQNVIKELARENLGISIIPFGINTTTNGSGDDENSELRLSKLNDAQIIVSPWQIVIAETSGGASFPELASAVVSSPAVKLLVPTRSEGWEWAGVDQWNTDYYVRQTVSAVKQIIENKNVKPIRPLGAGAIIGIVIGAIFLLLLLGIPIFSLFGGLF